jgi:hypothetical protein
MGFEALRSRVSGLYFGPLLWTLVHFSESSLNYKGKRYCWFSTFSRLCHAHFFGFSRFWHWSNCGKSRSSSSTEPILMGFEVLRSRVGEVYSGPLWWTLVHLSKSSPNHVGRRLCWLFAILRECHAHFFGLSRVSNNNNFQESSLVKYWTDLNRVWSIEVKG